MLPAVPTPLVSVSVPSTKAWLLMLSLLATLLVARHQLKPAAAAPAALAGRQVPLAPHRTLLSPPAPRVVFAASTSL